MGNLRAAVVVTENLATGYSAIRAPLVLIEALADGYSAIRASLVIAEALADGYPALRASLVLVEALSEANRSLRVCSLIVESLCEIPPEGHVSTELFPGSLGASIALPGLQYTLHKRPTFSTAVYKGASGVSVRRANMQYPIWEFDLSYEFLRDDVTEEYRVLRGFFNSRQGGFDTFLLKDKDDYNAIGSTLGTADGVTTQFPFLYVDAGGFADKVGQVDTANAITIYGTVAEDDAIPSTGPYTVTVANAATFVADGGVTKGDTAMVKVTGSPASGQYAVDTSGGVYTFNPGDDGAAIVITYRYTISPAAYTVTLPNLLVFTSAPASGTILSADFQFFYNCRFQDDAADFDKFADKFWELQKITLETVPQ